MALTHPLRSTAAPSAPPTARPRLAVLARPEHKRSSLPFALLISALILGTLVTMLVLNIQMSTTSYQLTRLEIQSQRLAEQEDALAERNEQLGTPQELDRRARDLGMEPTAEPAYIDLATGRVIGGDGTAAEGADAPQPSPAPASTIPPAEIYTDTAVYHGMGNEGA